MRYLYQRGVFLYVMWIAFASHKVDNTVLDISKKRVFIKLLSIDISIDFYTRDNFSACTIIDLRTSQLFKHHIDMLFATTGKNSVMLPQNFVCVAQCSVSISSHYFINKCIVYV